MTISNELGVVLKRTVGLTRRFNQYALIVFWGKQFVAVFSASRHCILLKLYILCLLLYLSGTTIDKISFGRNVGSEKSRAQFHGPGYLRILRLRSRFPAYLQAQNFCAGLVSVECLVTWSTHVQKPKFAANL